MTARTWIYTLNNYTEEDITFLKELTVSMHVCGKEVGENGTPHLQGAITFKRSYRLAGLKKLNNRIHWEIAKAKDPENYCLKEGNIVINIRNQEQGKRNDLLDVAESAKNHGLRQTAEDYPAEYIKFHRGIAEYKYQISRPKGKVDYETEVIVLWGPPGTGKTRLAWDIDPELYSVPEPSGKTLWFPGYEGENTILLDDFNGHWVKWTQLIKILDRYPIQVETKGGFVNRNWRRVIITSNHPPEDWYPNEVDQRALLRRITRNENVTDVTVTEVPGNTILALP